MPSVCHPAPVLPSPSRSFFFLRETVLTGKTWLYSRAIPAIQACCSHPPQREPGREDLLNTVPGQDGVGSSRSWGWSGSKIISLLKPLNSPCFSTLHWVSWALQPGYEDVTQSWQPSVSVGCSHTLAPTGVCTPSSATAP